MIDFTNFEKINDEAYIWRKFVSDELSDILFKESYDISNGPDVEIRPHDRIQLLLHQVDQRVIDQVEDFFKDTKYDIRYFLHWHAPRDVWFAIHRDEEAPDRNTIKKAWGGVIYLSDMDGGELFYPTNNTWVKPGKGDLVLHTASIPHGAIGVNGDNKRFITFVVYDPTITVESTADISPEEEHKATWEAIENSTEWLNSEIGIRWKKEYNWGPTHNEDNQNPYQQ